MAVSAVKRIIEPETSAELKSVTVKTHAPENHGAIQELQSILPAILPCHLVRSLMGLPISQQHDYDHYQHEQQRHFKRLQH